MPRKITIREHTGNQKGMTMMTEAIDNAKNILGANITQNCLAIAKQWKYGMSDQAEQKIGAPMTPSLHRAARNPEANEHSIDKI